MTLDIYLYDTIKNVKRAFKNNFKNNEFVTFKFYDLLGDDKPLTDKEYLFKASLRVPEDFRMYIQNTYTIEYIQNAIDENTKYYTNFHLKHN